MNTDSTDSAISGTSSVLDGIQFRPRLSDSSNIITGELTRGHKEFSYKLNNGQTFF